MRNFKQKNRKGMSETVPPIKDRTTLNLIRHHLKSDFRYGERNLVIFDFSYATLLRMVDVLRIRYDDVFNADGSVKTSFTLQEQKTHKNKTVWLDVNGISNELEKYRHWLNDENMNSEWLFPIKHPGIHAYKVNANKNDRPLSRHRYYLILKKVQKIMKLPYSLGNHSARKTSAWHFYVVNNYDIGALMKLLNHSSEAVTLHYIGESQKTLHEKLKNSFQH